jgi:OOP family OmpA-OmpF porin
LSALSGLAGGGVLRQPPYFRAVLSAACNRQRHRIIKKTILGTNPVRVSFSKRIAGTPGKTRKLQMKKVALIATIASLAIPFAAHAEGSYLGVNVGSAKQKYSVNGNSGSARDTAAKIYGGYNFDKNFGIEAGYADFGNAQKTFAGGTTVNAKSHAFYVAGTATAPINDQFAVFAKLGVTANRSKISSSLGDNTTKNNTDAIIGVGASYAITKELSAVAEYENFGKVAKGNGGDVKAEMYSVGLRYKF